MSEISTVDELTSVANTTPPTGANRHPIDLSNGLDLTEIAVLAVLGDPDLRAERARQGVAGAQAFAAGLLPDPQLTASLDDPNNQAAAGLVDAWGIALGYDIVPLITRQARLNAEHEYEQQIRLELLWREWQVIQQARLLAVRDRMETRRLALLDEMRVLYEGRYRRSAQGLREGNVTLETSGIDLSALLDNLSGISAQKQQLNQTRHDLDHLLGLSPGSDVPLSPLPDIRPLTEEEIGAQIKELPQNRPDLRALAAGYQAQEARVRAAILAQFPSFNIGIGRARDTGGVQTAGVSIGLNLPLFSGNRGAIAVERATRTQLAEAYQARLTQTQADVRKLLDLQAIVAEQYQQLDDYVPQLRELVNRARQAYKRGDIDSLSFLSMESTWINKRLEVLALKQTQWETRIALETLLAMPADRGRFDDIVKTRKKP